MFWEPEGVERVVQERRFVAEQKALGRRYCFGCKDWKARSEFARSQHRCRQCTTKRNKAAWARTKREKAELLDRMRAVVEEAQGERPRTQVRDGSEYACMDVGFSHRPIPRGQSKREVYCVKCEAQRCHHHPHLTPKQVVEQWKKWGK